MFSPLHILVWAWRPTYLVNDLNIEKNIMVMSFGVAHFENSKRWHFHESHQKSKLEPLDQQIVPILVYSRWDMPSGLQSQIIQWLSSTLVRLSLSSPPCLVAGPVKLMITFQLFQLGDKVQQYLWHNWIHLEVQDTSIPMSCTETHTGANNMSTGISMHEAMHQRQAQHTGMDASRSCMKPEWYPK